MDETLREQDPGIMATWMVYALARAKWIDDHVALEDLGSYTGSFEEEVSAREAASLTWAELKASSPELRDEYLDQLTAVQKAGFLKEYVWHFLRQAGWGMSIGGLQQQAFLDWLARNLPSHSVQTRSTVRIGK